MAAALIALNLSELFATLVTPKSEELVAFAYRHHDGKRGAEKFFLGGMTQAMHRLAEQAHPAFPVTIYYAFKQAETDEYGVASTGWETFLEAVIGAGFAIPEHGQLERSAKHEVAASIQTRLPQASFSSADNVLRMR